MDRRYQGTPFRAIDGHGADYLLTPHFQAADESDRHRSSAATDCVGLATADGRSVERIARGRYRLATGAEGDAAGIGVELFSDDPHAV